MRTLATILVAIMAVVLIMPVVWLALGSVRTVEGITELPPEIIPRQVTLQWYKQLFTYPIGRWAWNTLWTTNVSVILVVVFNCYIGYVFAKKTIPFKEFFFWLFMASMMIPAPVTFIPGFVLMKNLGLINRLSVLFVPVIFSVGWMFFFRAFIGKIPDELFDMAKIDGATELQKVKSIVLPLSLPAMASVAVFSWLGKWSDVVGPLLYLFEESKYTLTVGIIQVMYDEAMRSMVQFKPNYGLLMASSMVLMVPMVAVFIVCHRYFVKGIFEGAVKG